MTTTFDSLFATNALPALLDLYGETVTYRPTGGGTRAITAIVVRDTTVLLALLPDVPSERVVVRVLNDSTTGIVGTEVTPGRDQIDVSLRGGASPTTIGIAQIISDSAGTLTLACY